MCQGKLCIEVSPNSKIAFISEELCIGCGLCVKVSWSICTLCAVVSQSSTMSKFRIRCETSRSKGGSEDITLLVALKCKSGQ